MSQSGQRAVDVAGDLSDSDGMVALAEAAVSEFGGTLLRRLGRPEEIAAAVFYFASPACAYTTGQALAVSGGIQGSNLDMGIPDLQTNERRTR